MVLITIFLFAVSNSRCIVVDFVPSIPIYNEQKKRHRTNERKVSFRKRSTLPVGGGEEIRNKKNKAQLQV